jgi:hypothetical protein
VASPSIRNPPEASVCAIGAALSMETKAPMIGIFAVVSTLPLTEPSDWAVSEAARTTFSTVAINAAIGEVCLNLTWIDMVPLIRIGVGATNALNTRELEIGTARK